MTSILNSKKRGGLIHKQHTPPTNIAHAATATATATANGNDDDDIIYGRL
jgi:hypothetical protein